jgi:hypothetical protein
MLRTPHPSLVNLWWRCQALLKLLTSTTADNSIRRNALGCLQKFSLRRLPQSTMISTNTIEWLLQQLDGHLNGRWLASAFKP